MNEIRDDMDKTSKILAVIDQIKDDYEYIGIRTTDYAMDVNDLSQRSMVWDDGEQTDEELPGLSTTDIKYKKWVGMHVTKDHCHAYHGDHTYVIAGDYAQHGQDAGELVIVPLVIVSIA